MKTKKNNKGNKEYLKQNIIIFTTMLLLLTVVLLSFAPGLYTHDGLVQWKQVETNQLKNNHPFMSTFVWWLLSKIWFNPTCLLVFQIILLSIIWTAICNELKTENNFLRRWIYTVIICFIPIIFSYAITTWKDIIYSYMLVLCSLMIFIGIKKKFKYSYWNLFILNLSLACIWSYRYNGIIAVGLLLLTLLIIYIKNKIGMKKILISFGMFAIILGSFKIPEKIMCHSEPNEASSDIALFIISTLVHEDKIDEQEDLEIIDKIYNIEKFKEEYNPYLINTMSFSKYFNRDVAKYYSNDIYRILIKYAIKHPLTIVNHYLKADNLLIGLRFGESYVYVHQFTNWRTGMSGDFNGTVQPVFELGYKFYLGLMNFTLENDILKHAYLPAYSLYASIILMVIYCRRNKNKKYFLIILPMIFSTVSLLPMNIAQDLRYAYINYLTLLLIVIPLFFFKKRIINNSSEKHEIKDAKTLIIIPAYNEELNIESTVKDLKDNTDYDYIIINDCSKDNTLEVCKKNNYNYLSLPVNYGLTSGIQLGMKYALDNNYDIAIQFDGDGQHKAEYLKDLVKEIEQGNCNIAIGSRFVTEKKPNSMRMLGSNIISLCIKLTTGTKINDPTSGMRAYDREIIKKFVMDSSLTPEPDTIAYMIKKGKIVKEVQVEMKEREFGESYLRPLKAVEYMTNIIASILFFRNFQK